MSATSLAGGIRVTWTNPTNRDLAAVEVWSSRTNDRTTAVLIASPAATPGAVQSYQHTGLTPGDIWYYWVRAKDRSGNLSTYTPASATAGWSAVVASLSGALGPLPTITVLADGTTLTPQIGAASTQDQNNQTNTQSLGPLTINNPGGSPNDGHILVLRLRCSAVQTLTWGSQYRGSTDLPLTAATTGGGGTDYFNFRWNNQEATWDYLALNKGFGAVPAPAPPAGVIGQSGASSVAQAMALLALARRHALQRIITSHGTDPSLFVAPGPTEILTWWQQQLARPQPRQRGLLSQRVDPTTFVAPIIPALPWLPQGEKQAAPRRRVFRSQEANPATFV